MTTKLPIRTVYDANNEPIGLSEFQVSEFLPVSVGGTGGNTVATARTTLGVDDSNIRSLFSVSGTGSYDNTTGIITVTGGVTSVGGATGAVSNLQLASGITQSGLLTTANVVELTNLYFTNARVFSNVTSAGFATNANVVLKANITDLTTANVTEVTNLYFTNSRAALGAIPAVTQIAVTHSSSAAYLLDSYSGNNPTIYITAGETISFNLNVSGHPFMIKETAGGSNFNTGLTHIATDGTETTGSSAQGKVAGKLFWKVPFTLAGNTYVYQCSIHGGMVGNIVIQKPVSIITTTDVSEGTNLYFTNARVFSNVTSAGFATNASVALKANLTDKLNVFASTSSSELAGIISDETGTGKLVFATSPTFTGNVSIVQGSFTGNGSLLTDLPTVGFFNSTTSDFSIPTGDYGNLTDSIRDAFGIATSANYDCMDPVGRMINIDFGVLT